MAPVHIGPFVAEAAWHIHSRNVWDGGYSALLAQGPDRLLAATDAGHFLAISRAGERLVLQGMTLRDLPPRRGPEAKSTRDIESLTGDPATGQIWAGLEISNSFERYSRDLTFEGRIIPDALEDWGTNSGPEAFVRLSDGRFLAIEERAARRGSSGHRAVLYSGDPVAGASAQKLTVIVPGDFRPVDMAPLGDGRALLLYRRLVLGFPLGFESSLALIDIDARASDGTVRPRVIAELAGKVPEDNYEGVAITEDAGGRSVWLISDDNFMATQRSILLKLRWDQREKARE